MKPVSTMLLLGLLPTATLHAQSFAAGFQALAATHGESSEARKTDGFGIAGFVTLRRGHIRIEGRAYRVELSPDSATAAPFDLMELELRGSYQVLRSLAVELGVGRRFTDPEFATQEIGSLKLGLRVETAVSPVALVSARGAYFLVSKFSGGGSRDLAFEVGLGAETATPYDRVRIRADYEFQRIDRRVNQRDVPIQLSIAMVGLAVAF